MIQVGVNTTLRPFVWRFLARFRHSEPTGQYLIDRYRWYYKIPSAVPITEQMILEHWNTERKLARELLASPPESRWETFERCYTTLYSQFSWINRVHDSANDAVAVQRRGEWACLIGPGPKEIYEVGSGAGELIAYLAALGHHCRGTEVTRERGRRHLIEVPNVSWGISDGVHLARFENPNSYDVVISDQVVEHLHPDDLIEHLKGALKLLRPGGRYIFATPHFWYGPWDISSIFRERRPVGVHLREYGYRELKRAVRDAGFTNFHAVFRRQASRPGAQPVKLKASRLYLTYICLIETILPRALTLHEFTREPIRKLTSAIHLSPDVLVVAYK